jgi:hypothetical protein
MSPNDSNAVVLAKLAGPDASSGRLLLAVSEVAGAGEERTPMSVELMREGGSVLRLPDLDRCSRNAIVCRPW